MRPMSAGPALASATGMAGQFLVAKLGACDARLQEVGSRVLSSADEDAVHDLRVALRRTRTVLEVGRAVLGGFYADEVRRALRDLQSASGALRDEEVLLDLVSSLGADLPEVDGWLDARRRRERRLRGALRRKLREGELERCRRLLGALVAFRVKPARDRRLTKFARRAVEDARREVDRRRGVAVDSAEGLHRLRIAYKRLRYTVETFATVLPDPLAALAQPAARFQGRLGQLHDVDTAIASVRAAKGLSDAARAALLVELERTRRERAAAIELDLGTATSAPSIAKAGQDAGGLSLRKTSTR
jgi:CHAD domain-containing protein